MGAETADKNLKEMKAPPEELHSFSSSQVGVKAKSEPVQRIYTKKKVNTSNEASQVRVTCHRCGLPGH